MPRLPNPRHYIDGLRSESVVPETPTERALFVLLHGAARLNELVPLKPWSDSATVDDCLREAWDLYSVHEQRVYLEACLFSTEDNAAIASSFRANEETVQYYRLCFFDTSVFTTGFSEIPYLASLPDNTLEKQLMTIAFHGGFGALRFHFSRDKGLISEEEVLRTTMTDAYYRSQAHRGRALTHKATKEALKWAHTAITCGKMLMKEESTGQSSGDIAFKFKHEQTTTSIHQLETDGVKVIH